MKSQIADLVAQALDQLVADGTLSAADVQPPME